MVGRLRGRNAPPTPLPPRVLPFVFNEKEIFPVIPHHPLRRHYGYKCLPLLFLANWISRKRGRGIFESAKMEIRPEKFSAPVKITPFPKVPRMFSPIFDREWVTFRSQLFRNANFPLNFPLIFQFLNFFPDCLRNCLRSSPITDRLRIGILRPPVSFLC